MRTGVALVAALALAAPVHAQVKEMKEVTEVGGRSFSEWTRDITHKDPSKRESAIRAVMGFGPEKAYQAVPAMLTELRRHTPDARIDTSVRVNLAMSLGAILGAKNDADPKVTKDAVTLIIRLLRDPQAIVKYRAAQAIAAIGPPEARAATLDLLPLLRDKENYEVRQAAAFALAALVADPTNRVTAPPYIHKELQTLLTDSACQVRQTACQALREIGLPSDLTLRATVLKALDPLAKKDPEPIVQIWANVTIISYTGKIGGDQLETVTRYLQKGDVATRVQAVQALGIVGRLDKEVVPTLIPALADPDLNVVGWTVLVLGRIESARALPALEQVAADKKRPEAIQRAANESIKQIKQAKNK